MFFHVVGTWLGNPWAFPHHHWMFPILASLSYLNAKAVDVVGGLHCLGMPIVCWCPLQWVFEH